jgi:hypothetical protein
MINYHAVQEGSAAVDRRRLRRATARAIRSVVAVGAIVLMATGFMAGGPEHVSVLLMDTTLSLINLKPGPIRQNSGLVQNCKIGPI